MYKSESAGPEIKQFIDINTCSSPLRNSTFMRVRLDMMVKQAGTVIIQRTSKVFLGKLNQNESKKNKTKKEKKKSNFGHGYGLNYVVPGMKR